MSPNLPWSPPAFGRPMHISLPAINVQRSHAFYLAVFGKGWNWYGDKQPAELSRDELMLLDWKPDICLTAGIERLPSEVSAITKGRGGVSIWFLVEDIQGIVTVIEKSGGKILSETLREGENGLYRYFEDTEGLVNVVYQFVGQIATSKEAPE